MIRRMRHCLVAAGLPVLLAFQVSSAFEPQRELFDFDWRFAPGDPVGAETPGFDDTRWQTVDLPHDFCIAGPFDRNVPNGTRNGFRPLGVGWYRKAFVTPAAVSVWLDFEGVHRSAQIWVNGTRVARHDSGYHGFACDLTPHVRPPGQTNLIAVRADSSQPPDVTWYSGGGIYRHVWLQTAGPARLARHGVQVTTPGASATGARVHIRTEVTGPAGVTVRSEVRDGAGRPVGVAVATGVVGSVAQELTVVEPQLWSLTNPVLYRVLSTVSVNGQPSDRGETRFGIRTIRLTPDGLLLNGRRELVRGVNIHHDLGCLGVAAFDRAMERRLRVLKEMGCTGVRLSHNPHAPALLDLCDQLGLLVFDEAFCNWGDFERGEFARTWRAELEEFVRRDRNHPSVFVWSVGNQVSAAERRPDFGRAGYDAMATVVRGLDPTRPVTMALRPYARTGTNLHPLALHMDVMSANYMEKWFARDRLEHTNLVFITSECTTGDRGRSPWRDLDREHAVGLFYWGGIDYIGESRGWPAKCWEGGFVDWAGFRKPASWVLESLIGGKPVVRMLVQQADTTYTNWDGVVISVSGHTSHWNRPAGGTQTVEVVSNAGEVELQLNGRGLGARQCVRGQSLYWRIPWQTGTLVAIARDAGQEVARHELRSAGGARALRLTPDRASLRADGQDLAHVTVEVVDEDGVVLPVANHRVAFSVTGAGTNAGVQNGDPASDELFQADRRSVFQGRALLVVRSGRRSGEIVIKAIADGLEAASLHIPVRTTP